MKRILSLSLIVATAWTVAGLNSTCRAQNVGPSGDFHATVSNPESAVWDLSAIADLQNADYGFDDKSGHQTAHVAYANAFRQDGSGKFIGAGATTVTFGFLEVESGNWHSVDFSGTYKVTGSITSAGGKARGTFQTSASGTAAMGNEHNKVAVSEKASFQVDNRTRAVTGSDVRSASVSGHGSGTSTSTFGANSILPGDGGWRLDLTLATASNNKTITGTALVTLNSAQTYPFSVKGAYTANTQQSKLVLTGTNNAKGSSLQVTMIQGDVKLIKGKISGQFVNTSY